MLKMHLGYWLTGSEFSKRLLLSIQNLLKKIVVMACCNLHNYLRDDIVTVTDAHDREPEGHIDGALVTLNHQ